MSSKVPSTSKQIQKSAALAASSERKRRKRRTILGKLREGPVMATVPYLSLMADPLEGPLGMAHPPDSNTRPSVVWRVSQSETVTVPSTATAAVWEIRPYTLSGGRQTWPVANEILGTTTGSAWTDHTAIAAAFSQHRPLAMVVELEYVGPSDSAQGTIFCLEHDVQLAAGATLASFTDEKHYSEGSITNGASVAVISRMHIPFWTKVGNAMGSTDAPWVTVGVTGVLGDSKYRLRTTLVSEYTCLISSIMSSTAQSSPNLPNLLGAGQSIIGDAVTVEAGPGALDTLLKQSAVVARQAARAAGVDTADGAIRALYAMYNMRVATQGLRTNQMLQM